ncbi:MAG: hypothetical protein JSS10_03570 [Verrucomicrobia bacterium]|nr:hypothetical protein [Verrucomicrobiota bacterium]
MRHAYLKAMLPTMLVLTSLTFADEVAQANTPSQSKNGPMNNGQMQQMQTEQAAQPQYIEYHNRIAVFTPWHQVYERIQTDAFYVGVEGWIQPALSNNSHHRGVRIGEAELRMGYNYFYNGVDHVTPFLGVGFFKDLGRERSGWLEDNEHRHHEGQKAGIVYGVFGFLYDHEFNSVFNMGVNLKGIIGGPVSHRHHHWGSVVGGVDVSVPITFRFGPKRHWDIRLEPFDIYLHGSEISRNYFGGRSTIGYRF